MKCKNFTCIRYNSKGKSGCWLYQKDPTSCEHRKVWNAVMKEIKHRQFSHLLGFIKNLKKKLMEKMHD